MEIDYVRLGKNIRRARRAAGLSQEKISELAGISPLTVSRLENGVNNTSHGTLVLIAAALHATIDSLLLGIQPADKFAYQAEFLRFLEGCSNYERQVAIDTAKSVVNILQSNRTLK